MDIQGNIRWWIRGLLTVAVGILSGAPAESADLWVDDDGSQARAAGISSYKTSINQAISAAKEGDTIKVLPGVYAGTVEITKRLKLLAMRDRTNPVNPKASPDITKWPVIVEAPSKKNAITNTGGVDGITVQGFYIRKAGFNGIHFKMGGSSNSFRNLCENIYILGNRIENVVEDGIKVNQCNRVYISGNLINNFSTISQKSSVREHGIDFVAVGNSVVRNNKIQKGGVAMTIKGGSINVLVEKNRFIGPFAWMGVTAGEPASLGWMYDSARGNYQAKFITVRNNAVTSMIFWSCQSCSAVNNQIASKNGVRMKETYPEKSSDLCVSGSPVTNENVPNREISTSKCQTAWPRAAKVLTNSYGWDMRAGSTIGGLPY